MFNNRCVMYFILLVPIFAIAGCSSDGKHSVDNLSTDGDFVSNTLVVPQLLIEGSPQLIENQDDGSVSAFKSVGDESGNITLIWLQSNGQFSNLWSRRYHLNSGWEAATLLESSGGDIHSMALAVNRLGNVMVVWTQDTLIGESLDISRTNVWARHLSGGAWQNAIRIENMAFSTEESLAITDIGSLSLLATSDDSFTAVWSQHDGSMFQLWANRFSANTWQVDPTRLDEDGLGGVSGISVAADKSSHLAVVWLQQGDRYLAPWARYYDGLTWSPATKLIDQELGNSAPILLLAADDGFSVVWRQYLEGFRIWGLYAARHMADWTLLNEIKPPSKGSVVTIDATLDNTGRLTVVWEQEDALLRSIWANHYDNSWLGAHMIGLDNQEEAKRPSLILSEKGQVTALWLQGNGVSKQLWSSHYQTNEGWTSAKQISNLAQSLDNVENYVFSQNSRGDISVAWLLNHNGQIDLWASHFYEGTWSTPAYVEGFQGSAMTPEIIIDEMATTLIVWRHIWSNTTQLLVNRHQPGSGWQDERWIEAEGKENGLKTKLILTPSGQVIATWLQPEVSDDSISRFDLWSTTL